MNIPWEYEVYQWDGVVRGGGGGGGDCSAGHMHWTVHGAFFGHSMCIYWVVWWDGMDGAAYVTVHPRESLEKDTGRMFRHLLVYWPEG